MAKLKESYGLRLESLGLKGVLDGLGWEMLLDIMIESAGAKINGVLAWTGKAATC